MAAQVAFLSKRKDVVLRRLLAATQSKIMRCFCTLSLLPNFAAKFLLLNCVSVVVFVNHANKMRLTASYPFSDFHTQVWLDLGHQSVMPLSSFVIFKERNQPCLQAGNLVKEKEKAGGSSDPMSFTLLRSGLWTKLGVNLSGKDFHIKRYA